MAEMGISPVSKDWTGDPGDLKSRSDRILMKVALEGKSFQQARTEVEAEAAGQATPRDPKEGEATRPAPLPSTIAVDVVEVRGLTVDVHLERNGQVLDAHLESITARAVHVGGRAPAPPPKDPLVLDLTGEGPRTTGAAGARAFDLAADGDLRGTSFVAGGTAFLALDRNGNGTIDSGAELFGDQHGAANGYAELAKFDANGDARIDVADPVYARLLLLHGDGATQSLADAGVAALELTHEASTDLTNGGDAIFAQGKALLADGGTLRTFALGLNRFDLKA